ncbi:MAG: sulfide/dihydroorotate dehydrogenase-like FAD/NAD-binding protein [Chitinivibrionales bacterium]|nr:sulfide/dihydroorotate dehydrogenase-like FAD/NAD-binding protein [Chitinivibrionales bacterium]
MNEIIKREQLSSNVVRLRINAVMIAKKRKAGQFVMVRPTEESERIPLTIANADAMQGWIELIFQVVGVTTTILSHLQVGDTILDCAGPLGKPTHIEKFGRCVCVGGGVGIAPLYPIVSALHESGNEVITIIGARSKNLLILENEMKKASSVLHVTTDDGSYGYHGFVSDVLKKMIIDGVHFDCAIIIGPAMMMKVTSAITVAHKIPTMASLNPIMVDGTGMCGGCRVQIGKETKFACVDGPEFNAAEIDWDLLIKRLNSYKEFEKVKMEEHECKLRGVS